MPELNKAKKKWNKLGTPPAPPADAGALAGNAPSDVPRIDDPDNKTLHGRPDHKKMDVWQYMQLLSADQWQDTSGYLYRTAPALSRRSLGTAGYLLRFFEPITEEWVKQNYGGKEYRIDLIVRSTGHKLYTMRFGIVAPPILQPGEELETPPPSTNLQPQASGGTEAMQVLRTLVDDIRSQRDLAQERGEQFDYEEAFGRSVELLNRASNSSIDMILSQAKKIGSGGMDMANIVALIGALTPILLALFKQQNTPDPILQKLVDRAFAAPADPLDQLTKILEVADRMNNGVRRGSGSSSPWAGVIEKVVDRIPEALEKGKEILDIAAARTAGAGRAAPPRQLAVPPLPPNGPPPTPDSLHTSANPDTAAPDPDAFRHQIVLEHLKATLVAMALSGDPGGVAAQTADLIDADYAEQLCEQLRKDPLALRRDPILERAKDAAGLAEFIRDYIAWFDAADAGEPSGDVSAKATLQ